MGNQGKKRTSEQGQGGSPARSAKTNISGFADTRGSEMGKVYIIKTPTWNNLPSETKEVVKKRIEKLFKNLLSVNETSETNLPKAINMADAVSYLVPRIEESRLDEILKSQWKCASEQTSDMPELVFPPPPAPGEPIPPRALTAAELGASYAHKDVVKSGKGKARLSIAISEVRFLKANRSGMPLKRWRKNLKSYQDASDKIQKTLGIVLGNMISHEVRHLCVDTTIGGEATHASTGLGANGEDWYHTHAYKGTFKFSKKDFKEISKEISKFHAKDQKITAQVFTRGS